MGAIAYLYIRNMCIEIHCNGFSTQHQQQRYIHLKCGKQLVSLCQSEAVCVYVARFAVYSQPWYIFTVQFYNSHEVLIYTVKFIDFGWCEPILS